MTATSSLPSLAAAPAGVALSPSAGASAFVGPAGVACFESLTDYESLLAAVGESLAPADAVEWIWVKDLADLVWEMRRLRCAKAAVLGVSWSGAVSFMKGSPLGGGEEPPPETEGHAYYRRLKDMERLDRLITITGMRRDAVLRELEQRRARRAAGARAVSSRAQRRANRRNAKKSTGPRTAAGKGVVGGNALKHGLTRPPEAPDLEVWIAALGGGAAALRVAVAQAATVRVRRRRRVLIEAAETGDGTGVAEVAAKLLSLDDYERRARSGRRKAVAAMDREAIWENKANSLPGFME